MATELNIPVTLAPPFARVVSAPAWGRADTTLQPMRSEVLRRLKLAAGLAAACAGAVLAADPASAQRIDNAVAVFAALDKVTAKISRLEVPLNQTATFGALKITPRVCYSRAPTEPPKTTSFVEVEETQLDGKEKRIFSGWMFADSPGLNAVEHPVFDVWLTDCSQPQRQVGPRPVQGGGPAASEPSPPSEGELSPRRRRVPR
ncbi:MAG: DUF2155 domain-containing protein [Hyphomicrobiaceae bacterium]